MHCTECGSPLDETQKYCGRCGTAVNAAAAASAAPAAPTGATPGRREEQAPFPSRLTGLMWGALIFGGILGGLGAESANPVYQLAGLASQVFALVLAIRIVRTPNRMAHSNAWVVIAAGLFILVRTGYELSTRAPTP